MDRNRTFGGSTNRRKGAERRGGGAMQIDHGRGRKGGGGAKFIGGHQLEKASTKDAGGTSRGGKDQYKHCRHIKEINEGDVNLSWGQTSHPSSRHERRDSFDISLNLGEGGPKKEGLLKQQGGCK